MNLMGKKPHRQSNVDNSVVIGFPNLIQSVHVAMLHVPSNCFKSRNTSGVSSYKKTIRFAKSAK